MIELTMTHVNAICHAEFYLHKASSQFLEPHMRAQLEDDLLRLAELKISVLKSMVIDNTLFPPGI